VLLATAHAMSGDRERFLETSRRRWLSGKADLWFRDFSGEGS